MESVEKGRLFNLDNKVLIFAAEGFEELEALTVVDVLRRSDVEVDVCSLGDILITGAHGIQVKADITMEQLDENKYNAVVLPGGMPGTLNLKNNGKVLEVIKSFNKLGKLVCAICAAPMVLECADILKGKKATSYPDFIDSSCGCTYCEELVVRDNNIITSRGPATAIYFAVEILRALKGQEAVDKIKNDMLINFVEHKYKEA